VEGEGARGWVVMGGGGDKDRFSGERFRGGGGGVVVVSGLGISGWKKMF
jgi:hypothetical protein